jgi:mannitol/fructose-specific phosphotransferase system IIA component (Ntr-type)
MKLTDHITVRALLPHRVFRDKDDAIDKLVACLAQIHAIDAPDELASEVRNRDEIGDTAIGHGLAVPHARTDKVDRLHIAVATLSRPLQMPTQDQQPVDVFMLIVAPKGDPRPMLRVLARLARLVKHDTFLSQLRRACTAADMRVALVEAEDRLG